MTGEQYVLIGLIATIIFMLCGLIAMVLAVRDLLRHKISFGLVFFASLAAAIYFVVPLLAAIYI